MVRCIFCSWLFNDSVSTEVTHYQGEMQKESCDMLVAECKSLVLYQSRQPTLTGINCFSHRRCSHLAHLLKQCKYFFFILSVQLQHVEVSVCVNVAGKNSLQFLLCPYIMTTLLEGPTCICHQGPDINMKIIVFWDVITVRSL